MRSWIWIGRYALVLLAAGALGAAIGELTALIMTPHDAYVSDLQLFFDLNPSCSSGNFPSRLGIWRVLVNSGLFVFAQETGVVVFGLNGRKWMKKMVA